MTAPTLNAPLVAQSLIDFASGLAQLASQTVVAELAAMTVEMKPDQSPVTTVDLAVERALRERIDAAYPDHGVLGEEFGSRDLDRDWVWVIDPIDGTRQFAAGLPNYGVLIALCHRGAPVLGIICQPRLGDVYLGLSDPSGVKGAWLNGAPIRTAQPPALAEGIACLSDPDAFDDATRPGMLAIQRSSRWNVYDGGCLGYGALAEGRIALCLNGPNLDCFDICALAPVVEGAGGVITDWRGGALTLASSGEIVAAASPALHQEALALLTPADAPPR